ncbi:unnamed protein product [Mycena citricolor]|uniref:Protein kinase domain-containing protein n=1 Tax=Mycena citricolor TaxID=2018698 RepID=A0AAD2GXF1_9AGAR|nr:unnamed protein product [Mycena citricolor]
MRAANALAGPSDASTDTGHRPRSGHTWGYLEIADTTDSAPKRRVNLRGYLPYLLGCTSGDQPLSEAMMTCLGGDFVPVPLPAMHGHRSGGALLLEWNGRVDSLRGFNATSFLGEDGEEEGVVYINDNPAVTWQIMSLPHGARIVIASPAFPIASFTFCVTLPPPKTQLIRSHYEVIKQIGHGAFSAVYYVKDVRDGYCYALKTPEGCTIASILAAASQEVMALMAPPHPNVCRMFQCDYGTDMKSCDMILEYIHGIPIHRFVSECGFVPEAQARHLAFQLCVGLRHMHKEGISHGDIKGDVGRSDQCSFILLRRSQNVLVTLNEVGQPLIKIIDFGLARVKGNLNSLLSPSRTCYTAPEAGPQFRGLDGNVSCAQIQLWDSWALGHLVFFILAGTYPYFKHGAFTTGIDEVNWRALRDKPGVGPAAVASATRWPSRGSPASVLKFAFSERWMFRPHREMWADSQELWSESEHDTHMDGENQGSEDTGGQLDDMDVGRALDPRAASMDQDVDMDASPRKAVPKFTMVLRKRNPASPPTPGSPSKQKGRKRN